MHIYRINKPIFDYSADHPARQFLEAFIECRCNCVGKELEGIDQQWFSQSELRSISFSSFAYEHLAFDLELDGWLNDAKEITESERQSLKAVRRIRDLMLECRSAANDDDNTAIVQMCDQVIGMTQLWEQCASSRLRG